MTTPQFSLLHATYGRPHKAIAAMRMALERATHPERVEYIFAVNENDETRWKFSELVMASNIETGFTGHAVIDNFAGSAPAWDAAAKVSTGQVLIQMQDDLELPEKWDEIFHQAIQGVGITPVVYFDMIFFFAVSDGFRKDMLCCTAIISRGYYEMKGEFLHAGYRSVFSDDEVTYRALRDARDGKCTLIDARHIVFKHEHHYHNPAVPFDATYARGNSEEAYRIGSALFQKRNPEAATDGLVTWR